MMRGFERIVVGVVLSLIASGSAAAQDDPGVPSLTEQGDTMAAPPSAASSPGTSDPAPPPSAAGPADTTNPPPPSAARPEAPPEQNPYPSAIRHPISPAELARVRALLAPDRAAPEPVVHGDATAPFALGLSADVIFHSDVGFRLFDDRRADARLGVWLGYDLFAIAPRWILSGELGAGFENIEGDGLFGGNGRARLSSQTYQGSLSVRWEACAILSPQLRASGGASLFDLELNLDGNSAEHDHAQSGFGALGAGVLIHSPPRAFENRAGKFAWLSLGVAIEGGYALRSPIDFTLESSGGVHRIPISEAKLGRLDLSGPYLRTSLVARF